MGITRPFEVTLAVCLPRDAVGIRLVRRVTETALSALSVAADCREKIAVALTGACTNVVAHARNCDRYDVTVRIADGLCVIEVADTGAGFVPAAGLPGLPAPAVESGRGLYVIAALSDRFEVTSQPGRAPPSVSPNNPATPTRRMGTRPAPNPHRSLDRHFRNRGGRGERRRAS